jgi:peptidoglycan hydrolase CwlO-like protein
MKKETAFLVFVALFSVSLAAAPLSAVLAVDEKDISEIEKKIKKEQQEADALKGELNSINGAISTTVGVIRTTESVIRETEETIGRKEAEISKLEEDAIRNRQILRGLILEAYYHNEEFSLPEILVEEDVFRALNDPEKFLSVGDRINNALSRIHAVQEAIKTEKASLEETKEEKARLLAQKERERRGLVSEKVETEGDLKEQLATIAELEEKLRELKSDLAKITGKSYDAKDIREAVEFASKETGVPKGVLYGFLKMETNLGANTGQCTYKEVEKTAVARYKSLLKKNKKWQASIDLLYKRQDIFYDLVKSLGYSKDKKVSCTPSGYIGQGGAMGVPQFMSDVWKGYEPQIRAKTGHSRPDPWNLTDGVMAMALKLKKAGATSDKASVIKSASINYLGTFNSGYYNGIVYWSKNYKRLFQ